MNCKECQENITPYIDDEVEEVLKAEVQNHLDVCEKCRNLSISEKKLKFLVKEKYQKVSAPGDLLDDIKLSITNEFADREKTFHGKRGIFSYLQPVINYAAAAVLLIAVVSAFILKPWQEKEVDLAKIHLPKDFTYVSESENKITLTGTIVCICCEIKKKGANSVCGKYGHVYGLRTDNGVLWSILKTDKTMESFDLASLAGTRAKVTGWFFFNSDYIDMDELESVDYAESDSRLLSLK